MHPLVWQKVVGEQRQIVVFHGETLTPGLVFSEQGQACYLDAVIQNNNENHASYLDISTCHHEYDSRGWDANPERRRRQLQCLPQLLAGRQSRTRRDGFDDRIQAGAMAGPGHETGPTRLHPLRHGAVVLSWGSPGHDGAIHVPFAPGEGGSSGNGRRPSVPIDYQINWNELSAVATPQDGVPNSNCKGAEMQK